MTFKAAKCPNCAGELQVPDDRDSVKCMYCGSDIIVREAIKAATAGVNIENLLLLARNAEVGNPRSAHSYEEAFKYYTAVLEQDSKNIDAWIGKGFNGGRVDRECLMRAIEYSSDREETKQKILKRFNYDSAEDLARLAKWQGDLIFELDENNIIGILGKAAKEENKYYDIAYKRGSYDQRSRDNLLRVGLRPPEVNESILEYYNRALAISKNDPVVSSAIISLIRDDIRVGEDHGNTCPVCRTATRLFNYLGLSEPSIVEFVRTTITRDAESHLFYLCPIDSNRIHELEFLGKAKDGLPDLLEFKKAIDNLRDEDKSIFPPNYLTMLDNKITEYKAIISPPPKSCFIATAAYGSSMSAEVMILRAFRDEHLEATEWGKAFIKYYYLVGPHIATLIDRSRFLRACTRQLLKPVLFTVKKYYRANSQ